ncbi:MAG: cupredoxin domain-containing protein [Candidatus Limnocylindrales bacterium]
MTGTTRPNRPRRPGLLSLVGGIALSLGLAGIAAAWVGAPGLARDDATVLEIHFSAFRPTEVVATAGVPLRVTLVNTDPIDHEWLVGDAPFHERHRSGTEGHHGARPTEVSLPAGTTVTTTVTFTTPGDYAYICHLPGHEAYGMVGVLRVLPAR